MADVSDLLNFSTVRLVSTGTGAPEWAKKRIPIHLMCELYGLRFWCKDEEGDGITEEIALHIAETEIFGVKGSGLFFQILEKPSQDLTIAVAKYMENEETMLHFGYKVHARHKKYAATRGLPPPRLALPK